MNYPSAPIREAVFDIRIDKLNISNVADLLKIKELVSDQFPIEKKRHNITGTFQFSPDKPFESKGKSDITGFVFLSEDSSRQLQVRNDGFTLNILKPYEDWDTHFELFIKYWENYNELFKPNNIIRIATRFINRIEIPIPFENFQDFVTNMPPIPECLPQSYSNFFMQTQVPCHDGIRNTVLTETIEPVENDILPFILDIDVFQEMKLSNSVSELTDDFTEIRKIKNQIFENCITDKARKLFL